MSLSLGMGLGLTMQRGSSDPLGPEVVLNGGFDTDTIWFKAAGHTISGGELNISTGSITVTNQNALVLGKTYRVVFDVTNFVSGEVRVNLGWSGYGTRRSANGTYTEDTVCSGNTFIEITTFTSGFVGSVDNVSVREVL